MRRATFYISCAESGLRTMKHATRDRYVTRSVERALTILQLFALGEAEIGLSEISARVGLHQSTVFRLLATLSAAGFTGAESAYRSYRLVWR
jgi:DNA-binding MarR family transcriptional regulator